MADRYDVIIVGGGIAGLAAAYNSSSAGFASSCWSEARAPAA